MDIADAIPLAISVFQRHARSDNKVVINSLVEEGVSEALAVRLVEFVPMAFTRFMLSANGPSFPDTYLRMKPDGTTVEYRLTEEPVYTAAFAAAHNAQGGDAFVAVAGRSADFHGISDLLHKGSKLENIVIVPTVMLNDNADFTTPAPKGKRWWEFWR